MWERLRRQRVEGEENELTKDKEGREKDKEGLKEGYEEMKCRRGGEVFNPPKRYILVALLFSMGTLCYIVRTNIGILIRHITKSDYEAGRVLASLYYGYVITQLPSSLFIQYLGAKTVVLVAVSFWTVFDLGTLHASATSFSMLLFTRFGVGMGQGVVFPCNHNFAASWFPKSEKTFLVSILTSGMDCGTIIALLITPQIDRLWGWEYVFVLCGLCSVIWVALFQWLCVSRPEDHKTISPSELEMIMNSRTASAGTDKSLPWKTMIKAPCVWAIAAANIGNNYGWFVLLSWIPKYFVGNFGVDLSQDPFLAASPYITGWCMMQMGGWCSDYLICKLKYRVLHVRKLMCFLSTVIPAISLTLLNYPLSASSASLVLCAALGFSRLCVGSYWVNMIDIAPDNAEQVLAFSNTLGTFPGIIGNVVTGAILTTTGSWSGVFGVTSVVYILGGIVFLLFADDQPIMKQHRSEKDTSVA